MLLVPRDDHERGASVVAALGFVLVFSIFGFVTAVLLADSSVASARLQARATAAAANGWKLAALDPAQVSGSPSGNVAASVAAPETKVDTTSSGVSGACNPGEVHSIKEITTSSTNSATNVTTTSGKPKDEKKVCWTKGANGVPLKGPDYSDPACRYSIQTKCVVRYCPVKEGLATGAKEGTCFPLNCSQGDSKCLQDTLGSKNVADALTNSGGASGIQSPDSVSVQPATDENLKSALNPDAYTAQDAAKTIQSTNEDLAKINSEIQSCASVLGMDAGSGTSACNQSDLDSLYAKQRDVTAAQQQAQNDLTSASERLAASTKQIATDPGVTGSIVDQTAGRQITNQYGTFAYPNSPTEQAQLANSGFTCDKDSAGTGIACFKPATSVVTGSVPTPGGANPGGGNPGGGNPGAGNTFSNPGGSSNVSGSGLGGMSSAMQNGLMYSMGYMLGNLLKGNGLFGNQQQSQQQQMQCATTQDQYSQQLQTYNSQIQQYNYQLQQQQTQQLYGGGTGSGLTPVYNGYSNTPVGYVQQTNTYNPYGLGVTQQQPPQQPPQPCFNNQNPQQCSYSPQQPDASSCSQGTWKQTTTGNGCVSGWQCVPGSTGSTGTGTTGDGGTTTQVAAALSCEPKLVDVGMTLAISFSCQNAIESNGSGFFTGGRTSGSATTTIGTPPGESNTATYTLTCTGQNGTTAGAQCSVQIAKPSIVFVASPAKVRVGEKTALGWITSGMKSCLVSSADYPTFTEQNASYNSSNGVVATPEIAGPSTFLLQCLTYGGQLASQTATVGIIEN